MIFFPKIKYGWTMRLRFPIKLCYCILLKVIVHLINERFRFGWIKVGKTEFSGKRQLAETWKFAGCNKKARRLTLHNYFLILTIFFFFGCVLYTAVNISFLVLMGKQIFYDGRIIPRYWVMWLVTDNWRRVKYLAKILLKFVIKQWDMSDDTAEIRILLVRQFSFGFNSVLWNEMKYLIEK